MRSASISRLPLLRLKMVAVFENRPARSGDAIHGGIDRVLLGVDRVDGEPAGQEDADVAALGGVREVGDLTGVEDGRPWRSRTRACRSRGTGSLRRSARFADSALSSAPMAVDELDVARGDDAEVEAGRLALHRVAEQHVEADELPSTARVRRAPRSTARRPSRSSACRSRCARSASARGNRRSAWLPSSDESSVMTSASRVLERQVEVGDLVGHRGVDDDAAGLGDELELDAEAAQDELILVDEVRRELARIERVEFGVLAVGHLLERSERGARELERVGVVPDASAGAAGPRRSPYGPRRRCSRSSGGRGRRCSKRAWSWPNVPPSGRSTGDAPAVRVTFSKSARCAASTSRFPRRLASSSWSAATMSWSFTVIPPPSSVALSRVASCWTNRPVSVSPSPRSSSVIASELERRRRIAPWRVGNPLPSHRG